MFDILFYFLDFFSFVALNQRLNGMMIPVNINEHCRNIIARVGEEGVVTGEKKKVA